MKKIVYIKTILAVIFLIISSDILRAEYNLYAYLDKYEISTDETVKLTVVLTDPPIQSPTPSLLENPVDMESIGSEKYRAFSFNSRGTAVLNYYYISYYKPVRTGRVEIGPFKVVLGPKSEDIRKYKALYLNVKNNKKTQEDNVVKLSNNIKKSYYQYEIIKIKINVKRYVDEIRNVIFNPIDTSVFKVYTIADNIQNDSEILRTIKLYTEYTGVRQLPEISGHYDKRVETYSGMYKNSISDYNYIRKGFHIKTSKIEIKPLPKKEKPSNYYNLVGFYNINVSPEKDTVTVDRPFGVDVSITGDGILKNIKAPGIIENKFFKIYKEQKIVKYDSNSVVFKYVCIPIKSGLCPLPEFYLYSFISAQNKYIKIISSDKKINVSQQKNENHIIYYILAALIIPIIIFFVIKILHTTYNYGDR